MEQVHQVLERVQPVLFRRFDHAVDDRAGLCASGCTGEQPVLTSDHEM